jgi:hypothetical protein
MGKEGSAMSNKLTKSITENERYQHPRASPGPEALRASVPPQGVTAVLCGGISTLRSRHSLGNGTNKLVPLLSLRLGIKHCYRVKL